MTHSNLTVSESSIHYKGVTYSRPELSGKDSVILVELEGVAEYAVYERVMREGAPGYSYKWLCNLTNTSPIKHLLGTKQTAHRRQIMKGGRARINGFLIQHPELEKYVGDACIFNVEISVYVDRAINQSCAVSMSIEKD